MYYGFCCLLVLLFRLLSAEQNLVAVATSSACGELRVGVVTS